MAFTNDATAASCSGYSSVPPTPGFHRCSGILPPCAPRARSGAPCSRAVNHGSWSSPMFFIVALLRGAGAGGSEDLRDMAASPSAPPVLTTRSLPSSPSRLSLAMPRGSANFVGEFSHTDCLLGRVSRGPKIVPSSFMARFRGRRGWPSYLAFCACSYRRELHNRVGPGRGRGPLDMSAARRLVLRARVVVLIIRFTALYPADRAVQGRAAPSPRTIARARPPGRDPQHANRRRRRARPPVTLVSAPLPRAPRAWRRAHGPHIDWPGGSRRLLALLRRRDDRSACFGPLFRPRAVTRGGSCPFLPSRLRPPRIRSGLCKLRPPPVDRGFVAIASTSSTIVLNVHPFCAAGMGARA